MKRKPGPKTDKIKRAYASIGRTPVSVADVCERFNVSRPVMMQNKRFAPGAGRFRTRTINGVTMIYRAGAR
jgi:hypothetical protein